MAMRGLETPREHQPENCYNSSPLPTNILVSTPTGAATVGAMVSFCCHSSMTLIASSFPFCSRGFLPSISNLSPLLGLSYSQLDMAWCHAFENHKHILIFCVCFLGLPQQRLQIMDMNNRTVWSHSLKTRSPAWRWAGPHSLWKHRG